MYSQVGDLCCLLRFAILLTFFQHSLNYWSRYDLDQHLLKHKGGDNGKAGGASATTNIIKRREITALKSRVIIIRSREKMWRCKQDAVHTVFSKFEFLGRRRALSLRTTIVRRYTTHPSYHHPCYCYGFSFCCSLPGGGRWGTARVVVLLTGAATRALRTAYWLCNKPTAFFENPDTRRRRRMGEDRPALASKPRETGGWTQQSIEAQGLCAVFCGLFFVCEESWEQRTLGSVQPPRRWRCSKK